MAAYSILVGFKGEERTPVAIGNPTEINTAFKEAVQSGTDFDKLEIVTSRTGRTRRKRFNHKPAPAKKAAKKAAKKISGD